MYYFDNEFLQQYIDLRRTIKVTVNGEVLTITDKSDIEDPQQGTGYDASSNPSIFNYMDIEQIQVGPNIITIDKLQTMVGDEPEKPATDSKPSKPAADEPSKEEPETPPEDEEEPSKTDLAHFSPSLIGRFAIREYFKQRNKK